MFMQYNRHADYVTHGVLYDIWLYQKEYIHEIGIASQDNMFKDVRSLVRVYGDTATRADEVRTIPLTSTGRRS